VNHQAPSVARGFFSKLLELLEGGAAVQAVRDQERPSTIISDISDYTRESLKVAAEQF
jgi:dTDP-4-dehydrorhamnose reductase